MFCQLVGWTFIPNLLFWIVICKNFRILCSRRYLSCFFLTEKSGTTCGPFQITLLATNAKNTVVIWKIGYGASAVRRCPLHTAGFALSVGRFPGPMQAGGGTTACTDVAGLSAPLPNFPGGIPHTSPPVHPGILPGCGGRSRVLCPGGGIPYTHILPGGCCSSSGSSAQRADCSCRR